MFADFTTAVEPFLGVVIQTDLKEDEVNALRKALNKKNAASAWLTRWAPSRCPSVLPKGQ